MNGKKRRRSLDDLELVAREVTRHALEAYEPLSPEQRTRLTLGAGIDGDDAIFELYLAGETPLDAVYITRVRVSRVTGVPGPVEVMNLRRKF